MLKQSFALFALWGLGIVAVTGWSLGHVLGGTVTTDNAAGVIVFPLAWTFGFWPTVAPLLVARRIWRLQGTLEELCERRAAGVSAEAQEREVEETLTQLAIQENRFVPERLVRSVVRRMLRSIRAETA